MNINAYTKADIESCFIYIFLSILCLSGSVKLLLVANCKFNQSA